MSSLAASMSNLRLTGKGAGKGQTSQASQAAPSQNRQAARQRSASRPWSQESQVALGPPVVALGPGSVSWTQSHRQSQQQGRLSQAGSG